jgi:hypothetical protein
MGWSCARIAEVLGVSKQAAHKKHAKRIGDKYAGRPPGGEIVMFRRFTSGPRACVEAALEEARELGHDS